MSNNKIGLLNLHYSNRNYGAVLQAYALFSFLKLSGFEPVIIDFRPIKDKSLKYIFLEYISSNPFENFRKKNLKLTRKSYSSLIQLEEESFKDFIGVIVGSDQVWRLKYNFEPLAYFLPFVKKGKFRIAYAASFGVDYWENDDDKELTSVIKALILQFTAISVREKSGVVICKNTFGVDTQHVLDPTLLVGRNVFNKFIKNCVAKSKNIVYYKLKNNDDFQKTIDYVSEVTGFEKINIYYKEERFLFKKVIKFISFEDWLTQLANAEYIITDSYHCVCFAILFNKKFIYYPNYEKGFTRIESLLDLLGLRNRIFSNYLAVSETNLWQAEINYDYINEVLANERQLSAKFLLQSIQSAIRCNK